MSHQLINEGNLRSGKIQGITYNGWTITSKKASICNSAEMEGIQKNFGIPPPEMVFGNNYVKIQKGTFEYTWNAYEALSKVDTSENSSEHIKVSYASEWTKKSNHQNVKDIIKPYDWTYSTDYKGTTDFKDDWEKVEDPVINVDRLKQKEPILFYDENILYEDELADNGTAMLSLRMRVMPSCFLILQRFFLRVDDVLFRINDTRVYHEFGSPYLVREYTSKEQSYYSIKKNLYGRDISLLNDQNWVSSVFSSDTKTLERHTIKLDDK
ncbi:unnamed protein product [Cunninghamella echinulata]